MKENKKKLSLLANLDNILSNNFINTKPYDYKFYSMKMLVINDVSYDVSEKVVQIILYLDELIIEIHGDSEHQSYTLPYNFVNNLHILLED